MSLSASDLESFVASVHERSAGIDSERAVELRVVEPFLECLGWDVRGPAVDPHVDVGGLRVAYSLSVHGEPSIVVQTAAPGADLESDSVPAVADALGNGPVDWGIVTDGHRYVLLAHSDDGVHRRRRRLDALPDALDALQHYTYDAALERRESERTDRVTALRRLEERRGAAIDAVTESLVAVAGASIEDAARSGAARLVDDLLQALPGEAAASDRSTDSDRSDDSTQSDESAGSTASSASPSSTASLPSSATPGSSQSSTSSASADSPRSRGSSASPEPAEPPDSARTATGKQTAGSDRAKGGNGGTAAASDAPESADGQADAPPAPTARTAGDGEYVVRFFGGSASVGAVGTDNPAGTLVGVVRFLLENQDLANSVTLPWGVEADRAVLASVPEHPDGSAMTYYDSIEERWYVWTGGDEARIRAAIEELADAVGLRVMFQGDW